ncbi:uncharacterized protein [Clinocottus analis]|uniref:uncharacterized protein n=1 Tax=Clinocottus analis TaxID=304258 RepID=UPI0035C0DBCC
MDLRWLMVVLLCAEATDRFEAQVRVGQNATLTCSVNDSDVYWYIEVRSQVNVRLTRTFSGTTQDNVISTLNNKYTAVNNQLVISNVSAEDYRLYFCGRKNNGSTVVTDTFHLLPNVSTTSLSNNSAGTQQQGSCRVGQSELIVYGSLALNAVLVIVGLVLAALCLKRKICSRQVNEPPPSTSENPEPLEGPQYEEIHLTDPPPEAAYSTECVYYKAQLPVSPQPGHH